jgi:hypothetical protein
MKREEREKERERGSEQTQGDCDDVIVDLH